MDDIASEAQRTMFDVARESTPSRSGRTRESWLAQPVRHEDGRREAAISNDSPVATYLNYGTSPHEIQPRRKRAVETPEGPRHSVEVSGIEPSHMTEEAVEAAARTIQETTYLARERWKRECEESIEASKRRIR
jgi:hypothetical protein